MKNLGSRWSIFGLRRVRIAPCSWGTAECFRAFAVKNLGHTQHIDVQCWVVIPVQEAERLAAFDRSRNVFLNVLKLIVLCSWSTSRTDDDSVDDCELRKKNELLLLSKKVTLETKGWRLSFLKRPLVIFGFCLAKVFVLFISVFGNTLVIVNLEARIGAAGGSNKGKKEREKEECTEIYGNRCLFVTLIWHVRRSHLSSGECKSTSASEEKWIHHCLKTPSINKDPTIETSTQVLLLVQRSQPLLSLVPRTISGGDWSNNTLLTV